MDKKINLNKIGTAKKYHKNKPDMALQKLSETVSDLYTYDRSKAQIRSSWKKIESLLRESDIPESEYSKILDNRDLESLADLIGDRF